MTIKPMTLICFFALLTPAFAEVLFEKKVEAAQARYAIANLNKDKGVLALRLKADLIGVKDDQARHVFHLWADASNRVDVIFDPLQSQMDVSWMADGRRTLLAARNLYWDAGAAHHVALTWQPAVSAPGNAAAKMQLALYIDGQKVDSSEEAAPMKAAPATLLLGHAEIGKPLGGWFESVRIDDAPPENWPDAPAPGSTPEGHQWKETPEELAMLAKFNATQKVAFLAHVRGGAKRQAQVNERADKGEATQTDIYGIKMTSITQKMIKNGWLEKNKPNVLFGPGGGAEAVDPEVDAILRDHVQKGAGYFGICAGAIYAMEVGLLDRKESVKFSGVQTVAQQYDPTHPIFYNVETFFRGEPHTAYYIHYSGPMWQPTAYPDAKPIMMFDRDAGVAMWDSPFGKGRVVVSSSHPEMPDNGQWRASEKNALQQRRIFRNSFYYLTGMLPAPQSNP